MLPPFPNLSFNYVAPVIRADGTQAVLKAGVPNRERATEIEALQAYDGQNSVRVLEVDGERGIVLLERLLPGQPLTALADETNDEKATAIAAGVMRGLWRPAPEGHAFPTVEEWAGGLKELRRRFDGGVGPLPLALVEEAESLFAELIGSMEEPVLLHGDLHHDNILAATRQPWLAIDPKGLIGEPAYEVGAILRNLWQGQHTITNPGRLLERRVCQFSEQLGFDRTRVRGWGVAQAVLSAWWSMEDSGEGWEGAIFIAELLSSIKV